MYFAVRTSKNIGIMFLNEVALGREYTITRDDSSLRKAPNGYDSVVARGIQEPGQCSFHIKLFKLSVHKIIILKYFVFTSKEV